MYLALYYEHAADIHYRKLYRFTMNEVNAISAESPARAVGLPSREQWPCHGACRIGSHHSIRMQNVMSVL